MVNISKYEQLAGRMFRIFGITPTPADVSKIACAAVLKTRRDFKTSISALKLMGLPVHQDGPKNWDSLAALSVIRKHCPNPESQILDAGGEYYSSILPQLEACGYRNLKCINLVFKYPSKRGNIIYEYGNITKTKYKDNYFDGITCLSVIEHGVDINEYFKEMSRILKVNAILFTSTDYWNEEIDTRGKIAYGCPVRIFSAKDIRKVVRMASYHGFELIEPIFLDCVDRVVEWREFGLKYTFIYFALIKKR